MMNFGVIASMGDYKNLAAKCDAENKLLIPIAATGTGTGVFRINLYTTVTSTVNITGLGRFYTDAAGTLGASTSRTLAANTLTPLYIRLSSGSAYVVVDNASSIPCFGNLDAGSFGGSHTAFVEASNAPKINGLDISYLKNVTRIRIYTNFNLSVIGGSVADLTALTFLLLLGAQLTCSGSVKQLLKKLTTWYMSGVGITIYYETPDYFPATIDRYYLAVASITNAMADQVFIDLAASPVVASGTYKALSVPVPGGAVSDLSLEARNILGSEARGFSQLTYTTNREIKWKKLQLEYRS